MRYSLLLPATLLTLSLCACGTVPRREQAPRLPPQEAPADALLPCDPAGVRPSDLPVSDRVVALRVVLTANAGTAEALRTCEARRAALAAYIRETR